MQVTWNIYVYESYFFIDNSSFDAGFNCLKKVSLHLYEWINLHSLIS